MSEIAKIREKIRIDGLKAGDTITVGQRRGKRLAWEIMDLSRFTGDTAWVREHRSDWNPGFAHVSGVRVEWDGSHG